MEGYFSKEDSIECKDRRDNEFYRKLSIVEKNISLPSPFPLTSCLLCGVETYSEEFSLRGYLWPASYKHYINDHKVHPSQKFRQFILKTFEEIKKKEEHEKQEAKKNISRQIEQAREIKMDQ